MTKQFKGTSRLAQLADELPVRSRIGLALVAADLALNQLRSSHDFPTAQAAFELIRRWYDGDRFPPDRFENAICDEYDRGLALCVLGAPLERDQAAWSVLASALLYTAFHAYQAVGEFPSAVVLEVEEDELDELDKQLREISPTLISVVTKAADVIRQHPDISFARLKSSVPGT
jgi:Immunity protein Imm6